MNMHLPKGIPHLTLFCTFLLILVAFFCLKCRFHDVIVYKCLHVSETDEEEPCQSQVDSLRLLVRVLKEQRNGLSARANFLTKEFAKYQCEKLEDERRRRIESRPKISAVYDEDAEEEANVDDEARRREAATSEGSGNAKRRGGNEARKVDDDVLLKTLPSTKDESRDLDFDGNSGRSIGESKSRKTTIAMLEDEDDVDAGGSVSFTGGWCKETSKVTSRQHLTDLKLAGFLADHLEGKTVASFGDGPGLYKLALDMTGRLKSYAAFDGAPFSEETSGGRVQHLDFTSSVFGIPIFEWVVSLEVAEHIPREYEDIYIDNLSRHAGEGIVLSWASTGQTGLGHVNNRDSDYVEEKMAQAGFQLDREASRRIKEAAQLPWLKNNTNVYRRKQRLKADPNMA